MKLRIIAFVCIVWMNPIAVAKKGSEYVTSSEQLSGLEFAVEPRENKRSLANSLELEATVTLKEPIEGAAKTKEDPGENQDHLSLEDLGKSIVKQCKGFLEQWINKDTSKVMSEIFSRLNSHPDRIQEKPTGRLNPGNNNLTRWILSLVRAENESLVDFLRIYRVQLLYDLAFSVFKWFFYAWLGWILP